MINGKKLMRLACLLAGVALATGCDGASGPTPGSIESPGLGAPDLVVAEDRLGVITAADLDRFILGLPPDRRWQSDVEPAEWYSEAARRLAVERLLLDEAALAGVEQDPRFELRQRRIERQAYADHYLSQLPAAEPLTEEELRAFYDQHHEERYEQPERRLTFHIFRRFAPAGGRQAALDELEGLRQRVLAGESFSMLAREHSDSETRHRDGLLGRVKRGDFSADFDRVVFALAEKTPSEPLAAGDGAHVFYVGRVHEARLAPFEEVQQAIRQELAEERRRQRLASAAAELPPPDDLFVPGVEEIGRILRLGDRAAVLMRVGGFRLTIGDFQEVLLERRRQLGGKHVPDLALRLIEEIRDREIIYQHLRRDGQPDVPQERITRRREQELIEFFARQKMVAHLEGQPERVQEHYAGNAMRFSTPAKAEVTLLTVPLGGNPAALMARLEGARAELDAGRLKLAALAERHGGEVRDLGAVTAAQLHVADPAMLHFAFQLTPGEHSPPYQREGHLAMFRVDRRQEPEPRPLATVWDQVVQDVVVNYSPQLFAEVSQQLLDQAGFRLYRERLASLAPTAGS